QSLFSALSRYISQFIEQILNKETKKPHPLAGDAAFPEPARATPVRRPSTEFVRDPVPALRIHPVNVFGRAGDAAGAAFDAVFVGDGRHFLLLVPFVHVRRAEIVAVFVLACEADRLVADDEMRLVVAFVADHEQLVGNPAGGRGGRFFGRRHPFIALHPRYPSFIRFSVPPAASRISFIASFCLSALGTPSTRNMLYRASLAARGSRLNNRSGSCSFRNACMPRYFFKSFMTNVSRIRSSYRLSDAAEKSPFLFASMIASAASRPLVMA